LIATGARPIYPPIPGVELAGVFSLRALTDAQAIHAYIASKQVRSALIIGGGYIGVEMVEALCGRSLEVHLVEHLPQIMPNLDAEMVAPVAAHLIDKGARLHLRAKVTAIAKEGDRLQVLTDKAGALDVDMVVIATGVQPNSELAAAAGLSLGEQGAIAVDHMFRTSDADIFAAGDCVVHRHLVLDRDVWIPLATSANKGGRIAGENMLGGALPFPGILGTAIVKAFDYTLAVTGLTESEARESGIFGVDGEFIGATTIETKDRANYWPGAESLKVKLVFDRRGGRILGCQLVGKGGVNKRIDIVATAITAKMTLTDLTMLDLSYAPPYSTSHDPIQVCASVAQRELLPSQPV
jgi:NADPH-dependent 2,4-dienoyl-CoA reductase/sulfur reductase-like enzyme